MAAWSLLRRHGLLSPALFHACSLANVVAAAGRGQEPRAGGVNNMLAGPAWTCHWRYMTDSVLGRRRTALVYYGFDIASMGRSLTDGLCGDWRRSGFGMRRSSVPLPPGRYRRDITTSASHDRQVTARRSRVDALSLV
jgi:hypothetical protein